ncbi:hypothetical protein PHYPO_G00060760 [Pangasianodon hypophthalmus]|uniref:Uncharacterized protein n=1 Tax=Pangasianodon hypophthalmus TaxID=310915 RepID=A0A5N5M1A3_PANHP|nr:hypothetical protein PHYPO_G00060760 [Pangasianodon hypophthalmus]
MNLEFGPETRNLNPRGPYWKHPVCYGKTLGEQKRADHRVTGVGEGAETLKRDTCEGTCLNSSCTFCEEI